LPHQGSGRQKQVRKGFYSRDTGKYGSIIRTLPKFEESLRRRRAASPQREATDHRLAAIHDLFYKTLDGKKKTVWSAVGSAALEDLGSNSTIGTKTATTNIIATDNASSRHDIVGLHCSSTNKEDTSG
jgi:hypothetical protein